MKTFLIIITLTISISTSKIIVTSDLEKAISESSPGDTIELLSGTYTKIPYKLKSGTDSNPIIIKSNKNSKITFIGNSKNCIFELNHISHIKIEGNFELKDSLCGIKGMDVSNIKISNLKIHNIQQHGIVISGENNEISYNEIYDCVLENKLTGKKLEFGWKQCVASWGKNYNNNFSKNIIFKYNKIYNSYGEGLDFLKCDSCYAIGNEITNGFSMNIYLDASKNIVIDSNILKVNSSDYDTKWGSACGIGLSSESGNEYNIDNVIIKNNIIIGTRMAIYFFQIGNGGYNNIKILHNTMWLISTTTLWFKKPDNNPLNCELRNNFIYIENWIADFIPKSSWKIGNNLYYNVDNVPYQYSDTESGSKAIKNMDLNYIFNNFDGKCNYYDKNLNINCLRPSKYSDDYFKLYHSGSKCSILIENDINMCKRNINNPSIGAFEYSNECNDKSDDDDSKIDFDVKIKINYCTNGNDVVKITGSHFGKWNAKNALNLVNNGNCNWSVILDKKYLFFKYKFIIANGNNIKIWESGNANRMFDFKVLKILVKENRKGVYNKCNYEKNDDLVVLTCFWNVI